MWERLSRFSFDSPDSSFPYSKRLARECGWSHSYALRVVEEYRRFLYLAVAAGHPATPSIDVDEAWHLHMTYTRSYWDELCGRVLERPLHHDPTEGGASEDAKFGDWYARTLASYERHFGAAPPVDIWPPAEIRFDRRSLPRRVTARTHVVIGRERLRRAAVGALAAMLIVVAIGCSGGDDNRETLAALGVVGGVVAFLVAFVITARTSRNHRQQRRTRRRADDSTSGTESAGIGYFGTTETYGSSSDSGGGSEGRSDGGSDGGSGWGWFGGGGDASDSTSSDSGCGSSGCGSGCGGGGD